jgi:hypothetical protein
MNALVVLRIGVALLATVLVSSGAFAQTALQITLQVDAGTPVTITDSNDLTNDLNAADGTIEFTTTVDGVVAAGGRVDEFDGPIHRTLGIGSSSPSGGSVLHNLGVVGHTVTVTLESATYAAPGSPLGWSVFYDGSADDASGGNVEIAPQNDVTAFVDPGSGFVPLLTSPVSIPVTPPVPAVDQPVSLEGGQRGIDPSGDAARSRLVWVVDLGPDDEIVLPAGESLDGVVMSVSNSQLLCVVKMNKSATQVAKTAGGGDGKCLKTTGDVTACVDAQTDTDKVESRAIATFGKACTIPPAFGANVGTCCEGGASDGDDCTGPSDCTGGTCTAGACVSGAAEDAANAITHDLFGPSVIVTDLAKKCQASVEKALVSLHSLRWTVFVKTKITNLASLATESDFVSTCLGPPQPDASGKLALLETKLAATVQRRCIDAGVGSLASVFPGACAAETDGGYAACLARRVACRFCLGAIVADDIQSPLDCDLFDDGTANASCP